MGLPSDASDEVNASAWMPIPDLDQLRLTDFMDLPTLQEIQDGFAAVAGVKASITDAQGRLLTQPTPTREFLRRQKALANEESGPHKEGAEYIAPIVVNRQRLGTIRMTSGRSSVNLDEAKLATFAERAGLDMSQVKTLASQIVRGQSNRPAAIQFLFLLANAIARLCFQEWQLRRRIDELTAVYNVAMMLAETRDLNRLLQQTVELVVEVMNAKASSIRLIDAERDELVIKAVHNLSPAYLNKGAVRLSTAAIDKEALSPKGFCYVADMSTDPRVAYPQEAASEGIVSMLSVGMRYKGRAIGVLRLYTSEEKHFSQLEIGLLKAVAAQAVAAIENARLLQESIESAALEKEIAMAAEVQRRMVPRTPPKLDAIDLACTYVPCHALGGDLFDFIELPANNLGLVIADVSGKGVPASLTMASVRAAIRAHVDNVYYLYEVMRRLNTMVCRDGRPGEFVTLFYGVLDLANRRLTYCNAGHPPPLLLRNGSITQLSSPNLVLGVDGSEAYEQVITDLRSGDILLLYTDGLTDAMNFEQQPWGKQRLFESFAQGGDTAEIVAQRILWDMRRYVGLTQRTDDITMVVAKVR